MSILGVLSIIDQIVPIVTLWFNWQKQKASAAHLAATSQTAAKTGAGSPGQGA